MSENFQNRRQHVRVYRNFILSYKMKGKDELVDVSQINNLSRGGVSFISTCPFETGIPLTIHIRTPFLAEAIDVEGVVLDYKEKIAEMIYEIRVKFSHVPPQSEAVLKKIEEYAAKEI